MKKYKYKNKIFKTKIGKKNYIETDKSLNKAIKNKESKKSIRLLRTFRKGWIGK